MVPELLAPAGNLKSLYYAYAYGADAVYAGHPRYSLRARNNDFDFETIRTGIEYASAYQKKFFLTCNLLPHNNKVKSYIRDIEPVVSLNPDALIMADPGLIMMARERWSDLPIHLSVQANTMNSASVRFWQSIGIKRIILSRELSLKEVSEIRQACPDIELEVFVHGSLCIAYSGRCLLSGYFNHRDANQGVCTNACRWEYKVKPADDNPDGQVAVLEQSDRPGEFMPTYEDEHGTYVMNSKDLRAIEFIQRLAEIGVDSLKIEGRSKSNFYVARVLYAYRKAIDDAAANQPFDAALIDVLDGLANRGYTTGFYQRQNPKATQNYVHGYSRSKQQRFVGEVIDCYQDTLVVDVKNKFEVGRPLELLLPGEKYQLNIHAIETLDGQPLDVAPGSGHVVKIPISPNIPKNTIKYGLLSSLA